MPEISALMSVYNGAEFVAETIESILAQTYSDFEFIIVNDGSTDITREIIESFNDHRIRLFNFVENKGVGPALSFGLSKVQSKYVAKVDADDISIPTRFEKQKEFLDSHSDISVVGGFVEFFPHNEKVKNSARYHTFKTVIHKEINSLVDWKAIKEKMYWYCAITHPTIMGKTDVLKKIGYEDFPMGTDYNLFYNLNKLGYKMANLPQVLVKMRVSDSSITATKNEIFFRKSVFRIKKEEITDLLDDSECVFIWGAGSMGQNLFYALKTHRLESKVRGFIDSDLTKHGKMVLDKMIYSPQALAKYGTKVKVIIASQPGKFEIADYLESKGYNHLEDYLVYY